MRRLTGQVPPLSHVGLGDLAGVESAFRAAVEDHMPPITFCFAPPDALCELAEEPRFANLLKKLKVPF